MARKRFVCGNWKMHRTAAEARALVREVRAAAEALADRVDVAVAPPFTALFAASAELSGSRIGLAAQNLHWESQGAFTGEVSAPMLVEAGCRYVLCGHSERRQFFGDTDGAPAESWGGELCWKGELYWPARGARLNYKRILRLLLTGR